MRIAVGCDHRGYGVKLKLRPLLERFGHEVVDLGSDGPAAVDYPDFAALVARRVADGQAERGILICGSGIGMCITANKFAGIRAAACHDELTAEMCRKHNDVNVLCLSADMLSEQSIARIVEVWLATGFEGGRHSRRVDKIRQFEHPGEG